VYPPRVTTATATGAGAKAGAGGGSVVAVGVCAIGDVGSADPAVAGWFQV
jgi:hypothetical protein